MKKVVKVLKNIQRFIAALGAVVVAWFVIKKV